MSIERCLGGVLMLGLALGCARDLEELADPSDANCADGLQNGDETDIDCGGDTCDACPSFFSCEIELDCQSGVCLDGLCEAPSCSDGVKNGEESDVDCGENCIPCDDGLECEENDDCSSNFCIADSILKTLDPGTASIPLTCALLLEADLVVDESINPDLDNNGTPDLQEYDVLSGNLSINTLDPTLPTTTLIDIRGDLNIIGSPSLSDLAGLETIELITGDLVIRGNGGLQTLSGLTVEQVDGAIEIQQNPQLENLDGLDTLEFAGSLIVTDNNGLTDLSATNDSLIEVLDGIMIERNASLEDFDGFGTLEVTGSISISENQRLRSIDALGALPNDPGAFSALASVAGDIVIAENPSLQRIYGFDFMVTSGGILVRENRSLIEVDAFFELLSSDGEIAIVDSPALTTLDGFFALSVAFGGLRLQQLNALTDIPEFPEVTVIAGDRGLVIDRVNLDISELDVLPQVRLLTGFELLFTGLRTITGLQNLSRIDGDFVLQSNFVLGSVGSPAGVIGLPLGRITLTEDVFVANNDAITDLVFGEARNLRGRIVIDENTSLIQVGFPTLTQAQAVYLGRNDALAEVQMPNLVSLDAPFDDLTNLAQLVAPTEEFSGLIIDGVGRASGPTTLINVQSLETAGMFFAWCDGSVGCSIDTSSLRWVDGPVVLSQELFADQPKVLVDLSALVAVGSSQISTFGGIRPEVFIQSCGTDGTAESNFTLGLCLDGALGQTNTLDLAELRNVAGPLRMLNNESFDVIRAPQVTSIGGIAITTTGQLDITMPDLSFADDVEQSGIRLFSDGCLQMGACQPVCDGGPANACTSQCVGHNPALCP